MKIDDTKRFKSLFSERELSIILIQQMLMSLKYYSTRQVLNKYSNDNIQWFKKDNPELIKLCKLAKINPEKICELAESQLKNKNKKTFKEKILNLRNNNSVSKNLNENCLILF